MLFCELKLLFCSNHLLNHLLFFTAHNQIKFSEAENSKILLLSPFVNQKEFLFLLHVSLSLPFFFFCFFFLINCIKQIKGRKKREKKGTEGSDARKKKDQSQIKINDWKIVVELFSNWKWKILQTDVKVELTRKTKALRIGEEKAI